MGVIAMSALGANSIGTALAAVCAAARALPQGTDNSSC